MSNDDNKILKYNYGEIPLKVRAIIYADLECLLEKLHLCHNNPEKSYTEKKTKHTHSGHSVLKNCSFDSAENKFDCYRGKECMKRFCKDLKEHATKINSYQKRNGTIN